MYAVAACSFVPTCAIGRIGYEKHRRCFLLRRHSGPPIIPPIPSPVDSLRSIDVSLIVVLTIPTVGVYEQQAKLAKSAHNYEFRMATSGCTFNLAKSAHNFSSHHPHRSKKPYLPTHLDPTPRRTREGGTEALGSQLRRTTSTTPTPSTYSPRTAPRPCRRPRWAAGATAASARQGRRP